MLKLIIFDWDGVIVDSLEAVHNAQIKICRRYGKNYPHKTKHDFAKHYREPYTEFYESLGFDWENDKDKIKSFFRGVYAGEKIEAYTGTEEFLEKLRRDFKLAVASQGQTSVVKKKAEDLRVSEFFEIIMGNDGFFELKPRPDVLHAVLDKMGFKVEDAIYVGDLTTDVQTAKNAGMRSVAVTWGFNNREKLEKENPDFIADSFEELYEIIVSLK